MFINRKKLKLSIIASLIINSTYSYALNEPSQLISTKNIEFEFESIDKDSLRKYDSNKHIHGRMDSRELPTTLTSKYQNIIITSDKKNLNISHDVGKNFNPLVIKDFNNVQALSLSDNGRYLTAYGEYKNNNIFFVYDLYLKETTLFNNKNNISYNIEDDYYFTTNDGLFSLYSEDNNPYAVYTSVNEKNFFIFDNKNKKNIPLNEWNNTELNNHIEKNKFIAFENLVFTDESTELKPNITASSFSGKYLYGTLKRDNQKSDSVRLAFVYNKSNNDIKIISNSDYGSSRINQFSKNDIAVGWIESLIKRKNESDDRLIREAFIYEPNKNKIRKPTIIPSNHYYNSEATAISENGDIFVGWTEYGKNIIKKGDLDPLSKYLRNAFVYFMEESKSQLLPNLNNNIEESEAHSISKDSNAIFGISKDADDKWKFVAWNLEKEPKHKTEENQRKEAINIKFDTLSANNEIEEVTKLSNLLLDKLTLLRGDIKKQKETLSSELQTATEEMVKANKERTRIENIIDEGDKYGGTTTYDKYLDKFNEYKNNEDKYQKEVEDLNTKIASFNDGKQSKELKLTEYEYAKSQTTLNALTQKNATVEADKAEQDRLNKERADADKAEQERLEKERADADKAEQERLEKERADADKAEQDRLNKERADADKAEQERLEKERADADKAEQERLEKERADADKAEQDRLDKERADADKAEQERQDKERADADKAEQDRLDKERADADKAEQDRLDKERADAKAEQERQDKERADAKAEQERQDKERADAKAEQERQDKERADAQAEQERQDKERADAKAKQEQQDKERAEAQAKQERQDKERADAKAKQEQLDKERAEAQAEQERQDKERAEAQAKQERQDKERADAKAKQEQLDKERAEAQAEQERQDKERADKAKELIPVEDELTQRTKEKAKEKENTKPSIVISKPIDIENTYKSMQLMAENGYKLMDMQQGQLRYLASATCSVGTEKACISGFAHYQNVNKANATQTGLSGAYRFDINHIPLVVGLAIDTDVYSSLPKGYQYQGYALPLIGFSIDLMPSLNAELNSNALHLSLKGAYLNRKVSIERQALENTEAGKGNTRISGYHIDLQGSYPYTISNEFILTPFAGLTFNQVSRSAYSETQNAQFAAHYDALKTHSLLAKMGLGIDHLLGSSFILNTKAGLLLNLSHHQGDFRSHIDYLGQQQIDYSENKKQLKQRPFAHIGLTYQVDKQSSVNTSANWEMTTYRYHDMQFGVSYTYRF